VPGGVGDAGGEAEGELQPAGDAGGELAGQRVEPCLAAVDSRPKRPSRRWKEGAAGVLEGAAGGEQLGCLGGGRSPAEAEQGEAEGELQPAGDAGASLPGSSVVPRPVAVNTRPKRPVRQTSGSSVVPHMRGGGAERNG
jgi:hypothetical protein